MSWMHARLALRRSQVVSPLIVVFGLMVGDAASGSDGRQDFLEMNCVACHEGEFAEGGFDATELTADLDDSETQKRWIRIYDRVHSGEMPPPDAGELPADEAAAFLEELGGWVRGHQAERFRQQGRVRGRRLTDLQLERTLHDLLGIDIPLAAQLPEESGGEDFPTIAAGQSMSHFQLEQHLRVVDLALDEAFRRATSEPDDEVRELSAEDVVRRNPKRRTREPEMLDGKAVVWSAGLIFYGRLPATQAREDGWYRFRIKASALKSPKDRGVWCTVRSGRCVSSAPLLDWVGAFEATEEPREWTFEAWLPKGDMLEVRPGDTTLKKARFAGGQVGAGEGGPQDVPGVAIHSVKMERIHRGPADDRIARRLFGDLELRRPEKSKRGKNEDSTPELVSENPKKDAAELLTSFAGMAFRRPLSEQEITPYIDQFHRAIDDGEPLIEALQGAYRALLCSPRFIYFYEQPGRLDDDALASRLSYMLWNSMPDDELRQLAAEGQLSQPKVLHDQVERMLDAPRGKTFVRDFAADWLDLSQIDFTSPDSKMFRDFDLIVRESMLAETHAFLDEMIAENLSVEYLIDSDFSYLNSRLARFYEMEGITGDEVRKVSLDPNDHRGGVLTQGAILKVTANGTNTSPVIRGAWVAERLLGLHIPPPPQNVPAIEPDIRGATTIREKLAKHRSNDACASCHRKMDPPGFALENFNAAGQWRERYERKGSKGPRIDPSYEMPDGRHFEDIDTFRELVLEHPDTVARCVAEKMLSYGTGETIQFADREAIDEIVEQSKESQYGFRSLLHAVIASPVFQAK